METNFGGAKLWVIYPPRNMNTVARLYGQGRRFVKHHTELQGGVFLLQEHGQTVLLPPYCPHAVLTLRSSILCGREAFSHDFFPRRIAGLAADVADAKVQGARQKNHGKTAHNFLHKWVDDLEDALTGADQHLQEGILREWTSNRANIQDVLGDYPDITDKVNSIWERHLGAVSCTYCLACKTQLEGFKDHMMAFHLRVVRVDSSDIFGRNKRLKK